MPMTCKTCKFFWPGYPDGADGKCRRYPPQPVVVGFSIRPDDVENDIESVFISPRVASVNWCGEWSAMPDADDRISVPNIAGGKCEQ